MATTQTATGSSSWGEVTWNNVYYNPQLIQQLQQQLQYYYPNTTVPQTEPIIPEEESDMRKFANTFEVGCDPEFVVLYKANGALRNVTELGQGPVGWDHSGHCAELRPEKARGTWTLVKRMQELLNKYPKLASLRNGYKWRAGALVESGPTKISLGGHVHFNLRADKFPGVALDALDQVTKLLEHTDILPTIECQSRRKLGHYGQYGQVRTDTPDKHVEYRTMASWLFDPWIAFLSLTAAKLAVTDPETALSRIPKANDRDELYRFLECFRHKDINADRLLDKLGHSTKWLDAKPDSDLKEAWEKPLG